MFDAVAPSVDLSGGSVVGSPPYRRTLDGADFTGATVTDSPLATASLRRTVFTDATLVHPDQAFTDLSRSTWNVDETGSHPARWATLCRTRVEVWRFGIDGDRDWPS